MKIQDLQKDLAQNFTPDKAAEQKIFSAVLEAASRKNIIITDKRDNDVSGEKVFSSHTPKF